MGIYPPRGDIMRMRYRHIIFGAATALSALGTGAFSTGQLGPLPGTGHISGWILTLEGYPLADAEVALACPPLPAQRVLSDASGRFEFLSPEGNCRIIARKEGYVEATFDGESARGYGIAVGSRSTHNGIELRMAPAGTIAGIINAANGELPAGLRFQVVRREIINGIEKLVARSYALVRQDGSFNASGLPPGDYYLVASPAPYGSPGKVGGFAVTYFPGTSRLNDATVIAVKAGDLLQANFQLVEAPTFSASGVVYDAAGSPLSDIAVGVSFDVPPNWIRGSTRTGTDGRFAIGGLQDGSYVLHATRTNAAERQEIGEVHFDVNGADVPHLTVRMAVR